MPDTIALLPDHLANQIAAGEVIQRPASAVKELLENAIDAGATDIQLIIKDAGKELIRVIDNGRGMSVTDARRCFERHATSKIRTIDDLFAIRTMGFRGEALASVAAVAQVELKTKTEQDEAGTCIQVEHSEVISQELCQAETGTSISVKNLFFNVPARRNFLKSNNVELKHIVEEFMRVAMAYPEIAFRFNNNNNDLFVLEKGKTKQRVLALLGSSFQNKLVPVDEPTDMVSIKGFVTTPEASSRNRSNQYIFVNRRFIRSAYLNHAIAQAYQDLMARDEYPVFVLFLDIDPVRVDINVHPTKQEIKFEDERIIYSFVHSAVKHALSRYSIAPSLDFNLDPAIEQLPAMNRPLTDDVRKRTEDDFLFQSFKTSGQSHFLNHRNDIREWKEQFRIQSGFHIPGETQPTESRTEKQISAQLEADVFNTQYLQLNSAYIIMSTRHGFLLADQQLAHERVLYERLKNADTLPIIRQKCLIPQTLTFSPADAVLLNGLLHELNALGFELEPFGNHTFILQSVPADLKGNDESATIIAILEQYKQSASDIRLPQREQLMRLLARQGAVPHGRKLSIPEMERLMNDLFRCEQPQYSITGIKIFSKWSGTELAQLIQYAG
ncbi:MAG TPA: DNA mismatch repair endonuclease MutL [Chitinophagaceae bacterium]|nr:DNA mismatch repair endonuclease MutL [Chitinophagaceae bacterium]HNF71246.1 DNA mismatch repair endonuclease MutL [Chitinophagaceae bacterium]